MTQEDFERLKSALEKNLSAPGLSFVLAGLWTKDEIPGITSPEQYEAYQQIEAKLGSPSWQAQL